MVCLQVSMRVESKFWPAVSRIDDIYGDQNLVCSLVTPAPDDAIHKDVSPLRQVSA